MISPADPAAVPADGLPKGREHMALLTRQSIRSGAYLDCFAGLPEEIRWSRERIETSLAETMRARPGSGDLWLFV